MAHSFEWAIGYVGAGKKAETGEEAASQWSTLWSGPLARGRKAWKKGETVGKATSQWTTFSSGPLARLERPEKAETVEKVMCQWTTLWSGPLARLERPEKCGKQGESREPVDDSFEWTTSRAGKAKNLDL